MQSDLVLRNARLLPHPDAALTAPQDMLLRDGRIERIGTGVGAAPAGAKELDLEGRVVTAGFWNCHVHLTEPVWSAQDHLEDVQVALDDMFLSRGFTTAIDLGSRQRATLDLARRITQGRLRGPRILTAGAGMWPWRGLAFYLKDQIPTFLHWLLPMPLTPAGARRVVRSQIRGGAGVIKLFTGSPITPTSVKVMRRTVARAAVQEAHTHGLKVFTHPADGEGTAVGVAAGVDALAHVPDRTAGTAPLLEDAAERGIHLVPTLHMFSATVSADEEYLGPVREALRGFLAAGGPVLFGTDVGYLPDRDTRGEFEAMAACGMSIADILRSLTTAPSAFFALDRAGTLTPGHSADLTVLATTASSLEPGDLADVFAVVRDGSLLWKSHQMP